MTARCSPPWPARSPWPSPSMLSRRTMRRSVTVDFQTAVWTVAPRQETSRGRPTLTEIRRGKASSPGEQLFQLRYEAFEKNLTMASPATWIRQLENRTTPSGLSGCAPDVVPDGFEERHDCGGLKLPDCSSECGLAGKTGRVARARIEMIDRDCTRVDQVAA